MFVFGVSDNQIEDIVNEVSKQYDGNLKIKDIEDKSNNRGPRTKFTVTVISSRGPGSKVKHGTFGDKERRISAACWHAYRDVLIELFAIYPNARVKTMLATYNGRDDFYDKFPATGNVNVGSQFYPVSASECCDCGIDGREL